MTSMRVHFIYCQHVSKCAQPKLLYTFSRLTFFSSLFLLIPKCLQTQNNMSHLPAKGSSLRVLAFSGLVLLVTFSLTLLGVGVDGSSATVVISLTGSQGRRSEVPRSSFRCHGLKDRGGLTLEMSCLCNGLFNVSVFMDYKMCPGLSTERFSFSEIPAL